MFSEKLYKEIELIKKEDQEEFDNILFKSIGLYQAVTIHLNESKTGIHIFRDKRLNISIQESLSRIYNCNNLFFESLFNELNEKLSRNHLKLGDIGILKKDGMDIIIERS